MAVKIGVKYSQSATAKNAAAVVFQYCANPESCVPANFPGLEAFEKVKTDVYRWVFKKLSYSGMDLQIKLVTKFEAIAPDRILMTPVAAPDSTPGSFSGEWRFKQTGDETQLHFTVDLETELPLPFFLKSVAGPIAQKEITKLFDRYLANVAKALS